MSNRRPLTERQKKWIAGTGIALFVVLSVLVCWFAGRPLIQFAREPDRFRDWVDAQGPWGPLLFMGMVVLQIVVAIIPGEPLEIVAGYAFGALEVFFPLDKLQSLHFLQNQRRLTFWVFFLFFLPGTPKDVLCYIVGMTKLPLRSWLLISAVAPVPSIVTSTIGGDALGMGNYAFAALVFGITIVISSLGLLAYRAICRARERSEI